MPIPTLPLAQVPVGQKIWADVVIPAGDLVEPHGKMSTTMKKIFQGKPVRKQMIVLQNHGDYLICVYTSTFGKSTALPDIVKEPRNWYPVSPALGEHPPLLSEFGKEGSAPVWVCLSTTFKITQSELPILSTKYCEESVATLKQTIGLEDPPYLFVKM